VHEAGGKEPEQAAEGARKKGGKKKGAGVLCAVPELVSEIPAPEAAASAASNSGAGAGSA
jgi:hypothetical protein